MTLEHYEKEKAAIMAEYIREKQSVTLEYGKKTSIVELRYRDAEEGYHAASRRYSDSTIEIKNWFEYELAEAKKQVFEEEAASGGGVYEIQAIRNRHSERVTELIEKKHEKLDGIDIEWCAAETQYAREKRLFRLDTRFWGLIRRKVMDELKDVMLGKLKELAVKMQEEGGAE